MEINVTYLAVDRDPFEFSASRAERGENAGPETWQNALAEAIATPVLTDDAARDEARRHFRSYGAWEDEEIADWTDKHLDALVIQEAAAAIRELQSVAPGDDVGDIDWEEAERLAQEGAVGGRLYCNGSDIFLTLGD